MNRAASAAVKGNNNVQIVPDPFWTLARDCQPECLTRI